MALLNSYATLQEFLDFRSTTDTDTVDDGVVEKLLEGTSRYIDSYCGRTFYPRVEALLFDCPEENLIYINDDLCAVISLLNGDSTTIASSDYTLLSANLYPKWGVKLKDNSGLFWESDDDSSSEQVISLTGFYAYHKEYAKRGWSSAGTLAAAIATTTATTFTMTDGHTLKAGNILKIDNEVMIVSSIATSDTITPVARGDNGSTAATHLINTVVYKWNAQADIVQSCLEMAASAYRRRKGNGTTGAAQVTAAGVVITPQDVPGQAREILDKYVRFQ